MLLDIEKISKIEDKQELIKELKKAVELRDKMGGAMYWSILNDDCCRIANICAAKNCDKDEIEEVLGKGNYIS